MRVNLSTDLSIITQVLIAIVTLRGIYYKVPNEHVKLTQILRIETIVQFVELAFYIFIIRKLAVGEMASHRYFDWVITTPIMLITIIAYFKYEESIQNNTQPKEFVEFVKSNRQNILFITICNLLMLLFGYLGEIKVIDKWSSFILGFVFFILAFHNIYYNYAIHSHKGKQLFYIITVVWSLYGFAFILSPVPKNNAFNILDIFAKNIFGLYLYYKVRDVRVV